MPATGEKRQDSVALSNRGRQWRARNNRDKAQLALQTRTSMKASPIAIDAPDLCPPDSLPITEGRCRGSLKMKNLINTQVKIKRPQVHFSFISSATPSTRRYVKIAAWQAVPMLGVVKPVSFCGPALR